MNFTCNLSRDERIGRGVIGGVLLLGALIGFGRGFAGLVGIIMIAQGVAGWCGIPGLIKQFWDKKVS